MASNRPGIARKVFSLEDGEAAQSMFKVSADIPVEDLLDPVKKQRYINLANDLIATLRQAFKGLQTEPPTHPKPAYLSAAQIAVNEKMSVLYLPGKGYLVMINPVYTPEKSTQEEAKADGMKYSLSTLFANSFRISDDCYYQNICAVFTDLNCSTHIHSFHGPAAVAAQMAIHLNQGETPLDHNIDQEELQLFYNEAGFSKIVTARSAYMHHDRAKDINEADPHFAVYPAQIILLGDYVEMRNRFPLTTKAKAKPAPKPEAKQEQSPAKRDVAFLRNYGAIRGQPPQAGQPAPRQEQPGPSRLVSKL